MSNKQNITSDAEEVKAPARAARPVVMVKCEICGDEYNSASVRYPFCRSCYCPECGELIPKDKSYCPPCSYHAERFEEMAYGRDD